MAIGGGKRVIAALGILCGLGLASSAVADEPSGGPDPVVEKWPTWPYLTTCGGAAFDPVAVFGGPTGVERGSKPSEVALRRFLGREEWALDFVPAHDWRTLAETTSEVVFASGRLASNEGPAVMSFDREDGGWKWGGLASGCEPRSIVDGIEAVTWTLATDKPFPGRDARKIWVDLGPGQCSGGSSQNARARKPVIHRVDRKLMLVMTLRPMPRGAYTCPGVIEPPLAVRLPFPRGKLRLFDAGTYPPGNVVREWRKQKRRR